MHSDRWAKGSVTPERRGHPGGRIPPRGGALPDGAEGGDFKIGDSVAVLPHAGAALVVLALSARTKPVGVRS